VGLRLGPAPIDLARAAVAPPITPRLFVSQSVELSAGDRIIP
jgi:hypothetical protein